MSDERLKILADLLQPIRKTVVVDVGANPLERPTYDPLIQLGIGEVYAFEPQDEAREKLISMKNENMHILPYAVGDGLEATLHVCAESGFTSLLKPNPEFFDLVENWHDMAEVVETVPVETKRLDDMDEIPTIDLLKIDIQGGEQAVFENGQRLLGKVLGVITEVAAIPLYIDQPLLDDQMRAVRALGLHLHKFLFFKSMRTNLSPHPAQLLRRRMHRNQLIDGDAVFLRDLFTMAERDSEELKHLALISDCAIGSFDVAGGAVLELIRRGDIKASDSKAYFEQVPKMMPDAMDVLDSLS